MLIDFGFSRLAPVNLPIHSWQGTKSYVAPEMWPAGNGRDRSYDAQKADVWALGISLFAAASGVYQDQPVFPWGSAHRIDQFYRGVLTLQATRKSQVGDASLSRAVCEFYRTLPDAPGFREGSRLPQSLVSLLDAMLTVDPADRPSVAQLFWIAGAWVRGCVAGERGGRYVGTRR